MAEALELVPASVSSSVFQPGLLAVDVGAAPGGWTKVLAARCRAVIAVDPAALADSVQQLGSQDTAVPDPSSLLY